MTDHLRGKVVLVDPGLLFEPVDPNDQIGTINYIALILDEVLVDFEGHHGYYMMDDLLVFMPIGDIHQHLAELAYETPLSELKPLTQIDLILRYGSQNKEQMAMKIAQANPGIHRHCLETLNDQLYRDLFQNYGR